MMKVLFFGTPPVAVPFLEWLTAHSRVVGVVCRPDEPAGRGLALTPPPTKVAAMRSGLPVFQPEGPWTEETTAGLAALQADIGIIVAYGRILPRPVFMAPRLGSINIHFSLLPLYRGAAPIQWSLIRGESKTGVTAFWLEEGLDSGPIFHQQELLVDPADNVRTLREKLVRTGMDVLGRVMDDAAAGRLLRTPQEGTSTLAPQLKKEDGRISWEKPAADIVNLVRGVMEWPGASTSYRPEGGSPKNLKIFRATPGTGGRGPNGGIISVDQNGIMVKTPDGAVRLEEVQPEGKKPMPAWSFWQGARLKIGDKLG